MDYVCITLAMWNTIEKTFLVRRLHKLEFKTCLDSWSAWRLALDSVEQSQSSCVIIGLDQERYAEKLISYFPLQVSISYIRKIRTKLGKTIKKLRKISYLCKNSLRCLL